MEHCPVLAGGPLTTDSRSSRAQARDRYPQCLGCQEPHSSLPCPRDAALARRAASRLRDQQVRYHSISNETPNRPFEDGISGARPEATVTVSSHCLLHQRSGGCFVYRAAWCVASVHYDVSYALVISVFKWKNKVSVGRERLDRVHSCELGSVMPSTRAI